MNMNEEYLTESQAAGIIGCSKYYLQAKRSRPKGSPGPRYIRVDGMIRYRKTDVLAWTESFGFRQNTSQTLPDRSGNDSTALWKDGIPYRYADGYIRVLLIENLPQNESERSTAA